MGRVEGKVVIITGASRGQGLIEAQLLAKEGANVVAVDLLYEDLEKEVQLINNNGGSAVALKADVSSEVDWKNIVQETIIKFGKIDVLINNAAVMTRKSLEESSLDDWNKVMEVNAKGVFIGMKSVIPEMKKNGRGSIINISSIAGLRGGSIATGDDAPYVATKGAIRSLTKQAAFELGKYNIRVNSVHPGVIKTPMLDGALDYLTETLKDNVMLPQVFGEPEDIAYGVLYLASDESKYVTGTELVIDGGYSSI
ncbi:SDR family NAD(P)-dependent oxidoreductase [Bacillus sp. JJ1562]|uniref:SDR family NAD(P)-dependent oxidoreductase n=1 Tax=Bacillus sp. JJ1562 TaxID=3122960 RepID=UPI00300345D4